MLYTIPSTDQNTPPITYTLPYDDTVPENFVPGSGLFTLTVEDPDAGQAHTFRHTCTPAAATGLFEFNCESTNLKLSSNALLTGLDEKVFLYTVSIPSVDVVGPPTSVTTGLPFG